MRKTPRPAASTTPSSPAPSDVVAGLAGSIAHDFSNLLMVIRNVTAFLREELDEADPRQERVSALMHASDRARQLTEQLQAIGRGHLLKPEPVNPADMVRAMADTFRHMVPEDVQFRLTVRTTDATVLFDPAQLPIVVMRMLSYAGERARRDSHLLLVVDEHSVEKKDAVKGGPKAGHYVRIIITDTGRTVDAAEPKSLLAPRLAGRQTPRGTDLRLASVNAIVSQSGGFVEATTQPGQPFTIAVWLPRAPAHQERRTVPRHLHALKDLHGDEVILVVEDDEPVRRTVRESLERYGYTVLVAEDGEAAMRLVQLLSQPPDLLLTDLVMPTVTGRELIESLAVEGRLPKVLMMSGYTDDEVLRRAGPAETYPFIKKPFTHQELAAKVRQTLEAKPAQG